MSALAVAGGLDQAWSACEAGEIGCSLGAAAIRNNTFLSNEAGASGGAVMATSNVAVVVEGSRFLSNRAGTSGGALGFSGLTARPLTVTTSEFVGNVAQSSGGGIAVFSAGDVSVNSSTLTGNRALGGHGGGMAVLSSLTRFLCVAGQTLQLSGTRGEIAVANGDMPTTVGFSCGWHIFLSTAGLESCHLEARFLLSFLPALLVTLL